MSPIFQTSGALPAKHPTYVERIADQEALKAALDGEYLHLIAPRQTGKTSLLKRLSSKLTEIGWRTSYIDLSTLMDLPKPLWYTKLGQELAKKLTPNEPVTITNQVDLRSFLLDHALPWGDDQHCIALFFDEVEGAGKARDTDGLPFSDTFFMTLRNIYIQRDDYKGTIIVALAGAVNPSNLVKDGDISPFNIGAEIVLDDFTELETSLITKYLDKLGIVIDNAVHRGIHEWTNGHPYLTQRICAAIEKSVRDSGLAAVSLEEVKHVVEQIILKRDNALRWDNNLRHVSKMIHNLSAQAAQFWSLIQAGKHISAEEIIDMLYLELYLTGAVKTEDNHLIVRNRIYEKAFMKKKATEYPSSLNPAGIEGGKHAHIFISSTWHDLKPEHEAVEYALNRMQDTSYIGMEYFGSRPETPEQVSVSQLERSDIYLGIFAHWYGLGSSETEYRLARDRKLPCLIYFKDDSAPVPPKWIERDPANITRLDVFKSELKSQHQVSYFTSCDHLAMQIVADLHNLLRNSPTGEAARFPQETKYQINISHSQGIVVGDQAQVVQNYSNTPQLPESNA